MEVVVEVETEFSLEERRGNDMWGFRRGFWKTWRLGWSGGAHGWTEPRQPQMINFLYDLFSGSDF